MMISASNQPLYISTREMKRDWTKILRSGRDQGGYACVLGWLP